MARFCSSRLRRSSRSKQMMPAEGGQVKCGGRAGELQGGSAAPLHTGPWGHNPHACADLAAHAANASQACADYVRQSGPPPPLLGSRPPSSQGCRRRPSGQRWPPSCAGGGRRSCGGGGGAPPRAPGSCPPAKGRGSLGRVALGLRARRAPGTAQAWGRRRAPGRGWPQLWGRGSRQGRGQGSPLRWCCHLPPRWRCHSPLRWHCQPAAQSSAGGAGRSLPSPRPAAAGAPRQQPRGAIEGRPSVPGGSGGCDWGAPVPPPPQPTPQAHSRARSHARAATRAQPHGSDRPLAGALAVKLTNPMFGHARAGVHPRADLRELHDLRDRLSPPSLHLWIDPCPPMTR